MGIKHIILTTFFIGLVNVIHAQSERLSTIVGQVKIASEHEDSKPISACLRIESIKKAICTKERGTFRIDSVKSGEYRLEVVGFGFNPFDTTIIVTGEKNAIEILLLAKCQINRNTALKDIKLGEPRLLIKGGIAPKYIENREIFENNYGIKYEDLGDVPPPQECVEQYNNEVFEFLDKKFGDLWKGDVDENVVGIEKWK